MPLLPDALSVASRSRDADPLGYLRGALVFLFGGGIVVALVLAATGISPRALILAGLLWMLYGAASGLLDGVVEPLIEFLARVLGDAGLTPAAGRFSAEEALAARGHADAAAEAYRERARDPRLRARALVRRASLLAGPLGAPALAVAELEELQREADRLVPEDDFILGVALADLYETYLADRGRAMGEVRRLLDRYPDARAARFLRIRLAGLRDAHFTPEPS